MNDELIFSNCEGKRKGVGEKKRGRESFSTQYFATRGGPTPSSPQPHTAPIYSLRIRLLTSVLVYRSLVAHLLWEQDVDDSNPPPATNRFKHLASPLQ